MNFTIASYTQARKIWKNYTWVVSIGEPGTRFLLSGDNVFQMEFDDLPIPIPGYALPLPEYMEQMLVLGEYLLADPQPSALFHCQAGISRSSAMASIALLVYHHQDIEAAVSELFEKFPHVMPNGYIVKWTDRHFQFDGKFIEKIEREEKLHQNYRLFN